MILKQAILILFLYPSIVFGIDKKWESLSLDSSVSFKIIGEINNFDTIENDIILYQIYSDYDNARLVVQKSERLGGFQYEQSMLSEIYTNISTEMVALYDSSYLIKRKIVYLDSLKAMDVLVFDSNNREVENILLFLIDNSLYSMFYINEFDFSIKDKEYFFNSLSINIDKLDSIRKGKESFNNIRKFGYLPILIMILILIVGLVIRRYFK